MYWGWFYWCWLRLLVKFAWEQDAGLTSPGLVACNHLSSWSLACPWCVHGICPEKSYRPVLLPFLPRLPSSLCLWCLSPKSLIWARLFWWQPVACLCYFCQDCLGGWLVERLRYSFLLCGACGIFTCTTTKKLVSWPCLTPKRMHWGQVGTSFNQKPPSVQAAWRVKVIWRVLSRTYIFYPKVIPTLPLQHLVKNLGWQALGCYCSFIYACWLVLFISPSSILTLIVVCSLVRWPCHFLSIFL